MSTKTNQDKDEKIMTEIYQLTEKLKGYVNELPDDEENCTPEEKQRSKDVINQTKEELKRLDSLLAQLSDEE